MTMIWAKVKVTHSGLKMLKTIITEATFFSVWVFFHEHSRFTGQQEKEEGIFLTPHVRQTILGI